MTSGVQRPFHSYITIGLPRLPMGKTQAEYYVPAADSLLPILHFLGAVDPGMVLYVFPTKARKNPKANAVQPGAWSNSMPDRATLEIYTHQVWLRGGLRPFLRFFVGHKKEQDVLFSPEVHEQAESQSAASGCYSGCPSGCLWFPDLFLHEDFQT